MLSLDWSSFVRILLMRAPESVSVGVSFIKGRQMPHQGDRVCPCMPVMSLGSGFCPCMQAVFPGQQRVPIHASHVART